MAGPSVTLTFPDINGLAGEFRKLPKSLAATTIGAAVKRAIKPAEDKLKQLTPVGPTGNLKRGIATKAKRYPKTGTAVALVGYRKAGSGKKKQSGTKRRNKASDKTYHQFLVEYGTAKRETKSGANRGVMPAIRPIERASQAVLSQVQAKPQREMQVGLQKAIRQMPKYLAARAAKGRE